jgi:hypothetical protein
MTDLRVYTKGIHNLARRVEVDHKEWYLSSPKNTNPVEMLLPNMYVAILVLGSLGVEKVSIEDYMEESKRRSEAIDKKLEDAAEQQDRELEETLEKMKVEAEKDGIDLEEKN